MKLKLTARYALVITSTVLVVVATFGALFVHQLEQTGEDLRNESASALQRSLTEQITVRGDDIGAIVAQRSVNALYALDMREMREIINETMQIDGVESVVILDDQSNIVHDGSAHVASYGQALTMPQGDSNDDPEQQHMMTPIFLGEQKLGSVHLMMSLTPALVQGQAINRELAKLSAQHRRDAIKHVIGYAVLTLLAGLLLAWIAARHFARPILALASYARASGQGQTAALPAKGRGDEIGWLAGSIEQMRRDLTQSSGEAAYLAYHDSLTRLPNRAFLKRHLTESIDRSQRDGGMVALLFIDLDDFKKVNDTLGHEAGDAFLIEVADRLTAMVNQYNAKKICRTSLARLGGDEFTITMTHIDGKQPAEAIANAVIECLREPIIIDNQSFKIGASVGITLCPTDSDDLNTLLRYADRAMYRAKQDGRNTFRFFERGRDGTATRESSLETDLEQVLFDRGLDLHYQPIVDSKDGTVVAVEAFARWHHPVLGYVQPSRFVQLAEQTGRIEHLDKFVIHQLIKDLNAIREAGFTKLQAAANVASLHLNNAALFGQVEAALEQYGLDGHLIRLEVREKTVMRHLEHAATNIQRLRDLGVSIWIDNFGTRIATLKHIDMLPVSGIKIDSEFIDGISQGENARIVTQAITDMCHNMHLPVVAEAVEHPEQLEFLREIGCDYAQGYLFARPMPLKELLEYLNQHCKRGDDKVLILKDHFG
ncbi:MAG: putative bifunctional diguanylate cyclase/phosphodiesterase [Woeseiaceae bacterium]